MILYFKISPFPYHWSQFYRPSLLSKTQKCIFKFNHVLKCFAGALQSLNSLVEADICRDCCNTPALGKLAGLSPPSFAELGIHSSAPWESLSMWRIKLFSLIENGSWNVALCPFGSRALPEVHSLWPDILCFPCSEAVGPWTCWQYYVPWLWNGSLPAIWRRNACCRVNLKLSQDAASVRNCNIYPI